jgi:peptidoglycan/LPS O-acetylase OafA/YrhL
MVSRSKSFSWIKSAGGPIWRNFLLGGIVFWLPDLARAYIQKTEPSRMQIWLLTLGMPFAVVVTYIATRARIQTHARSVALSMLLGIWALGPSMMALAWTALDRPPSVTALVIGIFVFTILPPFTLMMAGYDLSILALLLVTAVLIVLHLKFEKGRGLFRTTGGNEAAGQHQSVPRY